MTTRRTYECNLCHEGIDDGSESKAETGYGVYFEHNHEIDARLCHAAENHICVKCWRALKKLNIPADAI